MTTVRLLCFIFRARNAIGISSDGDVTDSAVLVQFCTPLEIRGFQAVVRDILATNPPGTFQHSEGVPR